MWKGTLASGSTDGTVRLWNFETGEAIATLKGHTAAVNNVRIRGDVVVSASDDKSVRVCPRPRLSYERVRGCPCH